MAEATALAREMAGNPSRHLRWVKELLTANGSETDIAKVQQREGEVLAKAYVSPEHKEAVDAFLAKRNPCSRGRPAPAKPAHRRGHSARCRTPTTRRGLALRADTEIITAKERVGAGSEAGAHAVVREGRQ